MGAVVTSVRVDEDLLRDAKKYGIKLSEATEVGIQVLLEKVRRERAKRAAKKAAKILQKIVAEDLVEIIREGRER